MREVLTSQQRRKVDSSSDNDFYAQPRFVNHVVRRLQWL